MNAVKVWGKGANKVTGLTTKSLGNGKVGIGFAFGDTPHVLVVNKVGEGNVGRVAIHGGTKLDAHPKPAEGSRLMVRATPSKIEDGGKVSAFVDFRDDFKDGRRVVSCGPSDENDAWISFSGMTAVKDGKLPAKPTEELFKGDAKTYTELRDCRTYLHAKTGELGVVGSRLVGEKKDDTVSWKAQLIIQSSAKAQPVVVHETPLRGDPPINVAYEIPIVRKLPEAYVLSTRFGGSLMVGLLGSDHHLKGSMQSYPGVPTLPHISNDGDDVVLMASLARGKGYAMSFIRFDKEHPELPKTMQTAKLSEETDNDEVDPDFVRDAKGRRWVAHIDGARGARQLHIVPVDANLNAIGKHFSLTADNEKASEMRIVAQDDGELMVTYLRDVAGGGTEIVTGTIDCQVMK